MDLHTMRILRLSTAGRSQYHLFVLFYSYAKQLFATGIIYSYCSTAMQNSCSQLVSFTKQLFATGIIYSYCSIAMQNSWSQPVLFNRSVLQLFKTTVRNRYHLLVLFYNYAKQLIATGITYSYCSTAMQKLNVANIIYSYCSSLKQDLISQKITSTRPVSPAALNIKESQNNYTGQQNS